MVPEGVGFLELQQSEQVPRTSLLGSRFTLGSDDPSRRYPNSLRRTTLGKFVQALRKFESDKCPALSCNGLGLRLALAECFGEETRASIVCGFLFASVRVPGICAAAGPAAACAGPARLAF